MLNNIQHYRIGKGLTQAELAKRVGVTQQAVANWESGGVTPTVDKALKLADALGVSLEKIIKI